MKLFKSAVLCLGLAGCVTAASTPATTITLQEAKLAVLNARGDIWKDPYSIRDAKITQPYQCSAILFNPPIDACVCVEANAKNAMGGYVGVKKYAVLLSGKRYMQSAPNDDGIRPCNGLMPFPELEGKAG